MKTQGVEPLPFPDRRQDGWTSTTAAEGSQKSRTYCISLRMSSRAPKQKQELTRAAGRWSTQAAHPQTPRGGLCFHDVAGMCTNPWAHGLPGGIQAQSETRVSCSGGRPTTFDPHALDGAQCGEQRRLDLKHIKTRFQPNFSGAQKIQRC